MSPHILRQLAKTKGQCTLQCRAIMWISVQTPQSLDTNSLFEIKLDWQLPKVIIPLNVLHNINHKQPHELTIPIINMANTDVKLLKNIVLGSLSRVNNIASINNVSWEKMQTTSNEIPGITSQETQAQQLLPAFPEHSYFQIHAHNESKPSIKLQYTYILHIIQSQFNGMLNNEFTSIVSKTSAGFNRTNLVEIHLPITGLPVMSKPYAIPLKYKSFMDGKIKLLEDAGCISKSLSDWPFPLCTGKLISL